MKMDKYHNQSINQTSKNNRIPKVVFIDDGINPDYVSEGVFFDRYVVDGNKIKRDNSTYEVTHATKCYEIFRDRVQTPYHLISIKVLNNATGTGTHMAMLMALYWCANHDIDVINMSMGTGQFSDFAPVVEAINRLSHILIIAACSNSNTLTLPACLPTVIGVRCCKLTHLNGSHLYIQNPYDQIDVFVSAKYISASDRNDNSQIDNFSTQSNSLATPIITARICDYVAQGFVGLDVVRQKLNADSMKNSSSANYSFYKSLLYGWEDLSIPIVALINDDPYAINMLINLIEIFNRDGYRAIALTNCCKAKVSNLIFQLAWHGDDQVSLADIIELYYNFALPDILFLHMDLHSLLVLPKEVQADIVIMHNGNNDAVRSYWDEASILKFVESEENMFAMIRDMLS